MQIHEQNTDFITTYQHALQTQNKSLDISQQQAMEQLNLIYQYLILPRKQWQFSKQVKNKPKGVYLWGQVGSGKTWLMDLFYHALPIQQKIRIHFHHFLKDIHLQLVKLRGNTNPITLIAKQLISQYQIICFDEFFIGNMADAMILGDLFHLLLKSDMILVFTSNSQPTQLYKNGLNKDRIKPMLSLLEQQCLVLQIGVGKDYRRHLTNEQSTDKHEVRFRYPLNAKNNAWLIEQFNELNTYVTFSTYPLMINNRELAIVRMSENLLWCDFTSLCRYARSPADYIELASRFSVFFISNIPPLNDKLIDPSRRLIYLIDELYDRKKQIFITAENSLERLYIGEALSFEFQRTQSRLYELCFRD